MRPEKSESGLVDLVLDEGPAEHRFCCPEVVRRAKTPQVLQSRRSAHAIWNHMIDLQACTLPTAPLPVPELALIARTLQDELSNLTSKTRALARS